MSGLEIDAVELLVNQHREIDAVLSLIAETSDSAEKIIHVARLADLVTAHAKSEEEIFYPAAHQARTEERFLEVLEEHLLIKRLVSELTAIDPADKSFEGKFRTLSEQITAHDSEEEANLFPAALKLLSAEQRATLGREILERQAGLARVAPPPASKSPTQRAEDTPLA